MKFIVKVFTLSYMSVMVLFEWFPTKCHCKTENSTVFTIPSDDSFRRYYRKFSDPSTDRSELIVDVRHRAFQFVPDKILRRPEIQMLDLGENQLTNLPSRLANFTKLEYINLVDNRIANISLMSVVNELPRLETLVLSRNPIKNLKGLRVRSLLTLEADHCEIEEIHDILLDSMPSLRTLNLTGNPLGIMAKFRSENLTDLVLTACNLTDLPHNIFEGLSNLRYLDLRSNRLSTMPDEIFAHNNNLVYLSLSKNAIAMIKNVWFDEKKKLRKLDLSQNAITSINGTIFSQLFALSDLDLGDNRVHALPKLNTTAINVNLTKNFIANQKLWDLSDMSRVRSLDLSKNRLKGDCDEFKSESLRILDLGYNNMTRIKRNSFSDVPNLTDLNLKGNQFSHGVDLMIFDDHKILLDLELEENPWHCNCTDLFPLYTFVVRGQRARTSSLVCFTPETAKGDTWWEVCSRDWKSNMSIEEQVDTSKAWLIGISVLFIICLLIGTVVYIIYTFKKNDLRQNS